MQLKTFTIAVSALALLLVAGGAAGCSTPIASTPKAASATPTPMVVTSSSVAVNTFTMKGSYNIPVVSGSTSLANGAPCRGLDYAYAHEGTSVKVFDTSGKLLASGSLPQGKFAKSPPIVESCTFPFEINNVPDGPPMYSVEIGEHGGHPVTSAEAHYWVVIEAR